MFTLLIAFLTGDHHKTPMVKSSYITELIPNTKIPGDEFLNIDKRPPL